MKNDSVDDPNNRQLSPAKFLRRNGLNNRLIGLNNITAQEIIAIKRESGKAKYRA